MTPRRRPTGAGRCHPLDRPLVGPCPRRRSSGHADAPGLCEPQRDTSSMQIALGRKGDYAVRAVLELARHYGAGRRKAREIAAEMDIPHRYLQQILNTFVRSDLLTAAAGPDGGYE